MQSVTVGSTGAGRVVGSKGQGFRPASTVRCRDCGGGIDRAWVSSIGEGTAAGAGPGAAGSTAAKRGGHGSCLVLTDGLICANCDSGVVGDRHGCCSYGSGTGAGRVVSRERQRNRPVRAINRAGGIGCR